MIPIGQCFQISENTGFSREEISNMARWASLLEIPQEGTNAPEIEPHPFPPGVRAMQAILALSRSDDSEWNNFTDDDLLDGAQLFHADLSNQGVFNFSDTLYTISQRLLENRPLTRTELILTMKCPFLGSHRLYALSVDFDISSKMRGHTYTCNKTKNCICHHIPFN